MILSALVAASLVIPVATDRGALPLELERNARGLSLPQKSAVVRPLVSSATQCIARRVSTDPRFKNLTSAGEVNELIVDSVPSCVDAVRAMIDAYDRLFGEGSGETFFMGPYLDGLPEAVDKLVRDPK